MVAEFGKIVQSLHPIRSEAATPAAAQTSAPKIHPKVFRMITCWVSDSESPVVTEINLDAVDKNGNEFNQDGMEARRRVAQMSGAGYERIHALPDAGVEG